MSRDPALQLPDPVLVAGLFPEVLQALLELLAGLSTCIKILPFLI